MTTNSTRVTPNSKLLSNNELRIGKRHYYMEKYF